MSKRTFMTEDFLLHTAPARTLYHDFAKSMPIYDYHCHLPPDEIAADKKFKNMTDIWLRGDHYKWRALRAYGISEDLITGDASDEDKFMAWARTVPATMRNPLYHWTHLELRNPFGITELLNEQTGKKIYEACNEKLQQDEFSTRGLLKQMNVKVVCTTDDPVDSLEHHIQINREDFGVKVYPTWRPDMAGAVHDPVAFNEWVDRLETVTDISIEKSEALIEALRKRHDVFHETGCRLSDHGLDQFYAEDYSDSEIHHIFDQARSGKILEDEEIAKWQSWLLYECGVMDHEKDWTQQYHVGALRSVNSRRLLQLGKDTGFDSMNDPRLAAPLGKFLDRLASADKLTRTILYNHNPKDNATLATMIGNFQDGVTRGKMQLGSGWWFLDQKHGMIDQLNYLSNMGLLSCFVGMLTDSRSFLSYPRHDYFRRILCMLLGEDVANGELPDDLSVLGPMVQDICYNNAVNYFKLDTPD